MTLPLGTVPPGAAHGDHVAIPGFMYLAEFLPQDDQEALVGELELLTFTHDVFHGQRLKRSHACFGWEYVAVGRQLRPAPPFPHFLLALIQHILAYCPAATVFDMCLVQRYPTGAGIGWHVDAPRFGDVIAGVSVGAPGRLLFRPMGATSVSSEQLVAPGSLYVMQGAARRDFQHQVPPVKAQRYSLTFRSVSDRSYSDRQMGSA